MSTKVYPGNNNPAQIHALSCRTKAQRQAIGIGSVGSSLVSGTENIATAAGRTYSKIYEDLIDKIPAGTRSITKGPSETNTAITDALNSFNEQVRKNLEPISSFMGSTLATATGIIRDPFGSQGIGNVATSVLNTVAPGLGQQINGNALNVTLQNIQNFPSQLFSSIDHLVSAIDNILAIPLSFLAEVYYGYMDIMKGISELLNNVTNKLMESFFNFLDSLIPIKQTLELLQAVSDLASQIGGISTTFLGVNVVAGFTNQIQTVSTQIQGVLNNPMNLIVSALPPQIDQALNILQNPQQLINQFLPPELTNVTAKLPSIAGFGFNGNMGFGVQAVLDGLQGGALRSILTNFSSQYSVLNGILAGAGTGTSPNQSGTPLYVGNKYSRGFTPEDNRNLSNPFGP